MQYGPKGTVVENTIKLQYKAHANPLLLSIS